MNLKAEVMMFTTSFLPPPSLTKSGFERDVVLSFFSLQNVSPSSTNTRFFCVCVSVCVCVCSVFSLSLFFFFFSLSSSFSAGLLFE